MLSMGRLKNDSAQMCIVGVSKFFIHCILCVKFGDVGNDKVFRSYYLI